MNLKKISCLDLKTGESKWTVDAFSKYEGHCTMWGVCESPLIAGNSLIYTPGGNITTMVALDKNTIGFCQLKFIT